MLDEIFVSKTKRETINVRVDLETKNYLKEASENLNTTISAYILQLIENDKRCNRVSIVLDDDVYQKLKCTDGICTYSEIVNNSLRGILNGI